VAELRERREFLVVRPAQVTRPPGSSVSGAAGTGRPPSTRRTRAPIASGAHWHQRPSGHPAEAGVEPSRAAPRCRWTRGCTWAREDSADLGPRGGSVGDGAVQGSVRWRRTASGRGRRWGRPIPARAVRQV